MKTSNKIFKLAIALLLVAVVMLWFQRDQARKETFRTTQELRKKIISADKLEKLSEGYYQKLIADTLTKKQLNKLAADIIELKNREPISVTTTIIKPVEVIKETDDISVKEDSVFIEDYYPEKENSFLKYTNRLSLSSLKGVSKFKFDSIKLQQVVTKKENGLYQVDFKGPEFLELQSLDIQTEPIKETKRDKIGILLGTNYGKSMNTDTEFIGINAYLRVNKFYAGFGATSQNDFTAGIKIEL